MSPTRESRRRSTAGISEELSALLVLVGVVAVAVLLWAALSLGSAAAGLPIQWNPTAALLEVAVGDRAWPWQSGVIAAAFAGVAASAATLWLRRRHNNDRLEIDSAARTMQRPGQLSIGTLRANSDAARRLLKDAPEHVRARPGPPLGFTVAGNLSLHVPAEMCVFIEAGARTGKTMAWAIPAMMSAWGPVLATSNRPDLYRHTVLGRRAHGQEWLLDPQGVTGTVQVGFWVNLLRQVTTLAAARKLASFFVSASKEKDARVDSYFDGGAQDLLACYLLAAACAGGDLLHVAEWLGHDQDTTPALILKKRRKLRPAQRILEYQALYSRQRDGLFDMARRFLNVLSDEVYAQMVCPPIRRTITAHERSEHDIDIELGIDLHSPRHDLPEFDPREFVTSNDTLYALSIEGPDSAAPLTAALVGQVLESAFTAARARPDGRLAVPLLAVLDEAANCCPISLLPSYYTYAGGHGVILMTFLQVLEQGKDLWGENGLKTMRAQAIEVYGGGISDTEFLQQLSTVTDEHDVADRSHSVGPGGSNRTLTWRAEPILNVAALAALPKQRALVRLPGHRPILVRKPWWQASEHAALITASLAQFDETLKNTVLLDPDSDNEDDDEVEL
ncbi:type IV secretory system conjugative DNA transfer family protein [Nocardia sp. NPDC059691]|uniref:type IV secretory system conjugative DNA transfer family protein n=1 Tax=Nocardia sp. NPDC059691 TaxID=3346908 RepID=UPI00368A6A52